jgi:murein DD-endopeptidase MepM/ murein hydrolase activator NlpD
MKKRLTIYVLSDSGAPIRQASVPKAMLWLASLLGAALLVAFATVSCSYFDLKRTESDTRVLKTNLSSQRAEIAHQRHRILTFAEEINALKTELLKLNQFERKIRVIANCELVEETDSLFGVGGAIPDNLDTNLSAAEIGGSSIPQEMRDQVKALQSAVVKQKNGFETLKAKLDGQINLLAATPAIRPTTGWVTSRFGYRKSPFTGARQFHSGLDIATRQGTPVIAPADGAITFAGPKGLMGNMLTIRHGHGIVTRYGHLSKIFKKAGDRVKRGELIAHVGNTGRSTGPHLHYEVLVSGVPVNPARYILN